MWADGGQGIQDTGFDVSCSAREDGRVATGGGWRSVGGKAVS